MKILVQAKFCTFERFNGVVFRRHNLLGDNMVSETFEVKNAAEAQAAIDQTFDWMKKTYPGRSFLVTQIRHPHDRSRAFAGYKNVPFCRDLNEDTKPEDAPTAMQAFAS